MVCITRSTALFGSISYLSVVNNGRCDVSRGQGQGVEVETRTKQSPHGCIADDGSVRVKTECRPGVIRLDIGSIRGSKFPKREKKIPRVMWGPLDILPQGGVL